MKGGVSEKERMKNAGGNIARGGEETDAKIIQTYRERGAIPRVKPANRGL